MLFYTPILEYYFYISADFNCSFIPTRWSAPETLTQCLFSKMSDMWMVGHLIYEVLTHGRLPYADLEKDDTKLMEMVIYLTTCKTHVQQVLYEFGLTAYS